MIFAVRDGRSSVPEEVPGTQSIRSASGWRWRPATMSFLNASVQARRPAEARRRRRAAEVVVRLIAVRRQGVAVTRDERLQPISIDPHMGFGKQRTRGHRIRALLILEWLATAMTPARGVPAARPRL